MKTILPYLRLHDHHNVRLTLSVTASLIIVKRRTIRPPSILVNVTVITLSGYASMWYASVSDLNES